VRDGKLPPVDVYVDSPLAEEATKVYLAHKEYFDEEAKQLFQIEHKGNAVRLHFTKTVAESQAINRIKSGIIIMAAAESWMGLTLAQAIQPGLPFIMGGVLSAMDMSRLTKLFTASPLSRSLIIMR
jgi:trimethylamine:corrinoid methyltransferase-like protein